MCHQDKHKLAFVERIVKKIKLLDTAHGFLVVGRRFCKWEGETCIRAVHDSAVASMEQLMGFRECLVNGNFVFCYIQELNIDTKLKILST